MKPSRISILIICEERRLCDSLAASLESEGHSVASACGPREGVDAVRTLLPDLVLLEVAPGNRGVPEVIGKLQRGRETRNIPVIVISAHPELEEELPPVFDFLTVPVDVGRLREDIDIARRLVGREHRHLPPLTEDDSRQIADFLDSATGLSFDRRNLRALERGLHNRMGALKIGSYPEYFDYLVRHHETRNELNRLLRFLTVGETYFFRYHYHFDALRRLVLPEIRERCSREGRKSIRIWSAGCSTGEEPYSLAMTFMEAMPDWREWDVRIIATDISGKSLRKARDGVYGRRALRVTDRGYQERYFTRRGDDWVVRDEVRRLVEFSPLNLQADRFPVGGAGEAGFDVVFCRNVMIYFGLPTVRRLVEKFADSLVPEGYLFLGHSESLLQISTRFERIAHGGGFFYRKCDGRLQPHREKRSVLDAGARPAVPARATAHREAAPTVRQKAGPARPHPAAAAIPAVKAVAAPALPAAEERYREAQALFAAEEYEGASRLLEEVLAEDTGHVGALLTRGVILANKGLFDDALSACAAVLALDDLAADAYFLRGLILEMADRPEEAVEEYRRAILLDMDAVMPHYNLGRLYLRLGREREGTRELKNSLKALEKSQAEATIPFSGGLSREALMGILRGELR